jgi:hypothetical protein
LSNATEEIEKSSTEIESKVTEEIKKSNANSTEEIAPIYKMNEEIEINYKRKGKWYRGWYKGKDQKNRPGFYGVTYADTPKQILGVTLDMMRKPRAAEESKTTEESKPFYYELTPKTKTRFKKYYYVDFPINPLTGATSKTKTRSNKQSMHLMQKALEKTRAEFELMTKTPRKKWNNKNGRWKRSTRGDRVHFRGVSPLYNTKN